MLGKDSHAPHFPPPARPMPSFLLMPCPQAHKTLRLLVYLGLQFPQNPHLPLALYKTGLISYPAQVDFAPCQFLLGGIPFHDLLCSSVGTVMIW